MGVSQPAHYGTLDHRLLRVGKACLPDGEKPRPAYLGEIIELNGNAGAVGSQTGPREAVEPLQQA